MMVSFPPNRPWGADLKVEHNAGVTNWKYQEDSWWDTGCWLVLRVGK